MSLTPCKNGKTYKDLYYTSANGDWYINLHPHELVIKKTCALRPHQILGMLGFKFKNLKQNYKSDERNFGKGLVPAFAFWFEDLGVPFPTPRDCDDWEEVFDNQTKGAKS